GGWGVSDEPAVSGAVGGPVRFTARLSASADWTVTVRDQSGAVVATGGGTGNRVDWTWDSSGADRNQRYTWTIAAPDARSATGSIGAVLPPPTIRGVAFRPSAILPSARAPYDQATLSYRLNTQLQVTGTLLDASGAVVAQLFRRVQAAGRRSFLWKIVTVPDGAYQISLVARNAVGREATAEVPVTVDRTLGRLTSSATAFSPRLGRQVTFSFGLFGPATVQLRIMSGGTTLATLLAAESN